MATVSNGALFRDFGSQNGFEFLRSHMKIDDDVYRTLASVLSERSALELQYAKSLWKIQAKLAEKLKNQDDSFIRTWLAICKSMEIEAEGHRVFGNMLIEAVVKPINALGESCYKRRKTNEIMVDKFYRILNEKRDEELRAKRRAFQVHATCEKLLQETESLRNNTAENARANKMLKKVPALKSSSSEAIESYYDTCLQLEIARIDWENCIILSLNELENIKLERSDEIEKIISNYQMHYANLQPASHDAIQNVKKFSQALDYENDLKNFIAQNKLGNPVAEQRLYEHPAMDISKSMIKQRREDDLRNYIALFASGMEKESQLKSGCEKVISTYQKRPIFSGKDSLLETKQKYNKSCHLNNFYTANHIRFTHALDLVCGGSSANSNHSAGLSKFLRTEQDIYKLPMTYLVTELVCNHGTTSNNQEFGSESSTNNLSFYQSPTALASALGVRGSHDVAFSVDKTDELSNDFVNETKGSASATESLLNTEYKSKNEEILLELDQTQDLSASVFRPMGEMCHEKENNGSTIGWCQAKFDFEARDNYELSFKTGDVIQIYNKYDSVWWYGFVSGCKGYFPANYVYDL